MGSQFFMVFHNQYFHPCSNSCLLGQITNNIWSTDAQTDFLDKADLLCFFYKFRLQRHSTESINFTVNIMVTVRS